MTASPFRVLDFLLGEGSISSSTFRAARAVVGWGGERPSGGGGCWVAALIGFVGSHPFLPSLRARASACGWIATVRGYVLFFLDLAAAIGLEVEDSALCSRLVWFLFGSAEIKKARWCRRCVVRG